jgi:carbamoyltransferase
MSNIELGIHPIEKDQIDVIFGKNGFHQMESEFAVSKFRNIEAKLRDGNSVLIAGIDPAGHNTGASLVRINPDRTIDILQSNEEERFDRKRYSKNLPVKSVREIEKYLIKEGKTLADIDIWASGWNYPDALKMGISTLKENFPQSLSLLVPDLNPAANFQDIHQSLSASRKLSKEFGTDIQFVGIPHHDSHAYGALMVSPFRLDENVIVLVADGYGDEASTSVAVAENGVMGEMKQLGDLKNSLGVMYSVISSGLGGFPPLASEGRVMGLAGMGDMDRTSNEYYKKMLESGLVKLKADGTIEINQEMITVFKYGLAQPWGEKLIEILGEPVPLGRMWNPDFVVKADDYEGSLDVSDKRLKEQDRIDKAAALQLIFEDALGHVVEAQILKTGSDKLVYTGGTALNCLANSYLLKRFNEDFYEEKLGMNTCLHLAVPPNCSDTGIAEGAALRAANLFGGKCKESLRDTFLCGNPPSKKEILEALVDVLPDHVDSLYMGNVSDPEQAKLIADKIAFLLTEEEMVLGLYKGAGENGPRALLNDSIIADPTNPQIKKKMDKDVKYRETFRPLAASMTLAEAQRSFDIPEGASADNYWLLKWMILTVDANESAKKIISSVIHRDGSCRPQVLDEESDPFGYELLKAMGERTGVEAVVNTSLNVGSPIAQTPKDAIATLQKTRRMGGILMIAETGEAYLVFEESDKELASGVIINPGKNLLKTLTEYQ